MEGIKLQDLNIMELRVKLLEAVADVAAAEKEFSEAKKQLALGYKKIAPKGLSTGFTTVKFDQSEAELKQELIKKIKAAKTKATQIRHMTANLGNLTMKEFTKGFEDKLTTSAAVKILKNLGATDEEINDILKDADFNDEDYNEIKEAYEDYKANQAIEAGAQTIPREDVISFFMNRQQ